jgi:hypothetical protein
MALSKNECYLMSLSKEGYDKIMGEHGNWLKN